MILRQSRSKSVLSVCPSGFESLGMAYSSPWTHFTFEFPRSCPGAKERNRSKQKSRQSQAAQVVGTVIIEYNATDCYNRNLVSPKMDGQLFWGGKGNRFYVKWEKSSLRRCNYGVGLSAWPIFTAFYDSGVGSASADCSVETGSQFLGFKSSPNF